MSFWMREATLQIGGKVYGMDDLYFEFEVPFEDSDTLQSATFKAYNLCLVCACSWVCLVRSPYAGSGYDARNVNSGGTLNSNNAYNGSGGVRPGLVETAIE